MDYITRHDGYEYVSIIFATVFLVPQIYSGYRSGSLKDMSAATQWLIFFGSFLWVLYMYENGMYIFATCTLFVCMCSVILLIMKCKYYYKRVNEHFLTFDLPPSGHTLTVQSGQPSAVVSNDKSENV